MGPKGCAVTCLAIIILRYFYDVEKNPKKFYRPGEVCDRAKYTSDGSVYLNIVDELTNGKLLHTYDPSVAKYTMIQLSWGGQNHWVVQLGRKEADLCLDPWDGKIKQLHQPYWTVTNGRRYFRLA